MKSISLQPFNTEIIQEDEGSGFYVQVIDGYFFIYVSEEEKEAYIEKDDQIYYQYGGIKSITLEKDLVIIEFSNLFLDEIKYVKIHWQLNQDIVDFFKNHFYFKQIIVPF